MNTLLASLLCVLLAAPALAADNVDRAAAYKAALPLYTDNGSAPLAVKVASHASFPGCRMTRFSYAGKGGARVPALLYVPTGATRRHPVPCLVVLHGLGGNKELMAGFCRYLASAGYASLAIDLYHHGERTPQARSGPVTADALQQDLVVSVQQTAVDARRGLDFLQTVPEVDRARLGLAGFSLGAIIGTVVAGTDTRIKATVLVSGGGGWGEILKSLTARYDTYNGHNVTGQGNMDWSLVNILLAPDDPLTFAPHIAPRSLLLINGGQDATILPARAEALYAAASSAPGARVQRLVLPQAGHLPPLDTLFPAVRQWLRGAL